MSWPMRCLIVDDSAHFVAAARGLLQRQGFTVVGVASAGAEALRCFEELRPDVTLVDLDLAGESGFDVAEQLHRAASLIVRTRCGLPPKRSRFGALGRRPCANRT